MIVDTSGLLAAIDSGQRRHAGARRVLEEAEGPLVISAFVLAELDYLLATKVGRREQLALLCEVERGVYRLEAFSSSNVVLAIRYVTNEILTLDERHFRAVLGPEDKPFRVLPADL